MKWLIAISRRSDLDLRRYWAQLEAGSGFRMTKSYGSALRALLRDTAATQVIANLLGRTGHLEEALSYRKALGWAHLLSGNALGVSAQRNDQAIVRLSQGAYAEAERQLLEAERQFRKSGNQRLVATSLNNRAMVLIARGRFSEARACLEEARDLCVKSGATGTLAHVWFNLAETALLEGHVDESLASAQEAERIARELVAACDRFAATGAFD